jgi:hypothetical protein
MVPTAIGRNYSLRLRLLAHFGADLPGEADDSWDDQDLSGVNNHWGALDQPGKAGENGSYHHRKPGKRA